MPLSAREAALKALASYRRSGIRSDTAIYGIVAREGLDRREAALAERLCFGVLQNMILCDYYIACFSTIPTSKMEPSVLDILRISVYQLAFLTKIPSRAAVSEGVALTKKRSNAKAAGFVNAVLRNISKNLEHLPEVRGKDAYERLSIMYSHPRRLVERFCAIIGLEQTAALLKANNSDVPIYAQINPIKSDINATISALERDNVKAVPHPWLNDCITLNTAGCLGSLEAFKSGWLYIQDPAARLAVLAAAPKPGMFVIDGCAAPGGKSFAAAAMMENKGRVLSCDISEPRLRRTAEGAVRLGLGIIETQLMDASKECMELKNTADIVIADVPCSGFGVIRKKPEIRYKPESETALLPQIQLAILSNLSLYVKVGGTLLYSTCTMMPEENEDVVDKFLKTHKSFKPEAFSLPGRVGRADSGKCTLWPHLDRTDGFFICRLRREA